MSKYFRLKPPKQARLFCCCHTERPKPLNGDVCATKNAEQKKVDECLKVFYLWLNCEAKLREHVHVPNRVQFQIHPLSDVKVG